MSWTWVTNDVALSAHREQLSQHGGGEGVREVAMFESAMMRPQNLAAYGEPNLAALAASYAFDIARNHPFVDGNKRTAAVVAETFILLNDYVLTANNGDLAVTILALAAGELSEDELAQWFREHLAAG